MANDENKHINNQNNRYNGNQLHDDFIHGHSNEELIPKAHDINDIEQYIHNIPALNDPSNRNTLNNITKPSVNFFANLNATNTTGNMNNYYTPILPNYSNGHDNDFPVSHNINAHSFDGYNNDNIQENNILGVFDNNSHLEKHKEETVRKYTDSNFNNLTGIPQLDTHVIANMSWFQNPPYKNLDAHHTPALGEKETTDAIIANMNLDLSHEQPLGIAKHNDPEGSDYEKSTKKSAMPKKTKARKALIHDLSLLTKQNINEISPLLGDMSNYHKYLQTSQFKNDTKTQRRVQKRKSLLKKGPKRPSSAYFFYCQKERKNLQQQYPNMLVPELQRKLGEQWRALSDEEKKPYLEVHRLAWEKYKVEKDEYMATLPPKKPSGPFVEFINSQKDRLVEKNQGKKLQMQELTRLCVEEWRNLDENTKLRYNLRHKQKIDEWIKAYNDIDVKELKDLMQMKEDMLEAKKMAIEKNRAYTEELSSETKRQNEAEGGSLDEFNQMDGASSS
ncbi:hypothetical protein ACO0OL_000115 [Hanseniaspora opuntiae]